MVLTAGRFGEQKNFGDLVTAAAALKNRGEYFHLVIAGDGDQRPLLQNRVRQLELQDMVSLPGNLVNLDQVMLAADVFIMSSLWEGLPLVLLEAMAAGLPGVAYGIPGIEELIVPGENGVVVPVGNPEALADGLAELLQDPLKRQEMGQAGRRFVEREYGFSQVIDKLVELYRCRTHPGLHHFPQQRHSFPKSQNYWHSQYRCYPQSADSPDR